MNKNKVHIVAHTHWDREWYFTTARSKVYLQQDMAHILDILESDEKFYYFTLDAQASLLDDYLRWEPTQEDRIKKLVKQGKLIIGPWYTQSDLLLAGGENLIRNLLYGIRRCNDFGKTMMIGYVPDSFGQSGNMPQIYKSFGINETIFMRGANVKYTKNFEFKWKGIDGSEILAVQIPYMYGIGGMIPEGKGRKSFWEDICLNRAGKYASTSNILFPSGFDQSPIRENLPEIIRKQNEEDRENIYVISSYQQFIEDVKQKLKIENIKLNTVQGEFLLGKHMRVHKTIFSSRSDIKVLNTYAQNYLVYTIEPLLCLSYLCDNRYPQKLIRDVWYLLFENSAHDSLGSCMSDAANQKVYNRYIDAIEILDNVKELHMRLIALKNKQRHNKIFIFNALPYVRSESLYTKIYVESLQFEIVNQQGGKIKHIILDYKDVSDYVLNQSIQFDQSKKTYKPDKLYEVFLCADINNISPLGYTSFEIVYNSTSKTSIFIEEKNNVIENGMYKISLTDKGDFIVFDKQNNKEYKNQFVIADNGDGGDSFNYSPPQNDFIVYSNQSIYTNEIKKSDVLSMIKINYVMQVPRTLKDRECGICNCNLRVELTVKLDNRNFVDVEVSIENNALSHRMCILINSGIMSNVNYASQQFGTIERKNYYSKDMIEYKQSIDKKDYFETWHEEPINIEFMDGFVYMEDSKHCVSVMSKGVREYQIRDNTTIALTLFRTYGQMGKEELLYRPGRPSGEPVIKTPDAQIEKVFKTQFGVYYGRDVHTIEKVYKTYISEIFAYQNEEYLDGRMNFVLPAEKEILPEIISIMRLDSSLSFGAIKKAEDNKGYIIRIFNANNMSVENKKLFFQCDIVNCYEVNSLENKRKVQNFTRENRKLKIIKLKSNEFISLYIELNFLNKRI
ncbi:MAG: glycoside hydrolase family 38 C-terminal domain-containing protein [Breznakia sp.]